MFNVELTGLRAPLTAGAFQPAHGWRHHDQWVGRRAAEVTAVSQQERVEEFRRLHESGCFVMPNPWDVGSAKVLQQMGFPALATTSAGMAWTFGRTDNHITLEQSLDHLQTIAGAVTVPVNADFEGGFAVEPEQVNSNVSRAAATGVAGLSIEDSTGDAAHPLHDLEPAVERIRAARQAIDDSGTGVVLTARSEGFIVGRPDLGETIRRLCAFAEAGADCLYAPGIRTVEQISAVVDAVRPKPVNLLINAPFITVAQAAELGVRRISVGGALARTAWVGFLETARQIADAGTFSRFQDLPDVDGLLGSI
jgi:2-methylisocitrate lyase-like PEP mutase family enzyme